jgi:isopenicillin-N epimerase
VSRRGPPAYDLGVTTPPRPIPGARLLFTLDPGVAHLNHGSFGAVPITVQRAQRHLREEVESSPQRFYTAGLADRLGHVRRHLAGVLGADPESAALVTNATAGVALALRTVRPAGTDEIVTTDHGYGAVDLAVDRLCARTGAAHRKLAVPLTASDEEITAAVAGGVHPTRTRVLIVDQITSPTGRLLPVADIVAAVRARAPRAAVIVDAAHVPGMLAVSVDSIGADFWVGNLHKWGFAPRGTALLAVSERWRRRIEPSVVSWGMPEGFPESVEMQGTVDYTPWLAAPAGMYLLRSLGLDAVRAHNTALACYGQHVVGRALGLAPEELPAPGGPVALRLVPLPAGLASDQAAAVALREAISRELATEVAVSAWQGRGYLRLSAQIYNLAGEYDRFAAGLPRLLASIAR